jgi:hypothetical protein
MVFSMTLRLIALILLAAATPLPASDEVAEMVRELRNTYDNWREAVIRKDARKWQAWTAEHRRVEVRNRLVSEKRPFPAAVFDLPAPPPSIRNLRCLFLSQKGPTAKASFFGKVDFGVGGEPTDNLLVLSFVRDRGRWLYDRADFVNLVALPDVRRELAAGKMDYFQETPEVKADGSVPPTPAAVPPAEYIAKVYVFCPGREVRVEVNGVSRHRFANAKEAEIVIGGARDGRNEVEFTTEGLEGGTGEEALAVRVYLMSEIEGTKPIIAYEYLAKEGEPVPGTKSGSFRVDPETARRLTP